MLCRLILDKTALPLVARSDSLGNDYPGDIVGF